MRRLNELGLHAACRTSVQRVQTHPDCASAARLRDSDWVDSQAAVVRDLELHKVLPVFAGALMKTIHSSVVPETNG